MSDNITAIHPSWEIIHGDALKVLREFAPTLAAKDIRTLIRALRAERYLLASESLAEMAAALLDLMSMPPDGDRPFSDYVRHMIGPARTLATIQRQIGGVLTPTVRKELDRISSAIHLFLEERSDLVFYTAADDDGGTLLCASISDLTAQLQATLWSQPQPVLLTSGTLAICKPYAPSAEAIRLANAINRALEQPGDGKEALSHILQGAAARYACCDDGVDMAVSQTQPDQIDWERFERTVSHIIIGTDNAITVHF